jgi:multicomponent Na+:H+ antiporter subunit G
MIATSLTVCLAVVGAVFLLLAGIGILRLPDLFCRASATTKAATLGVGCVLVAAAFHFGDLRVTTRVLATIAFLLLTAPVAAHMIARAAYRCGTPLWTGTVRDELRAMNGPQEQKKREEGPVAGS